MAETRYQRRIARRLLIYIVLFSSLIAAGATAVQLCVDYRHETGEIAQRLAQVKKGSLPAIARDVQAREIEDLQTHADGLLTLPDMQYVEIVSAGAQDDEKPITSGKVGPGGGISRTYEIVFEDGRSAGTLTLVAGYDGVYNGLIRRGWIILASNAVRTVLVSIFFLIVFHRLVTRHLVTMAGYAQCLDAERLDRPLRLKRRPSKQTADDELGHVVTAFNQMRENLRQVLDEHHRVENVLRQREEEFRMVFDRAKDAIIWVDMDSRLIIRCNPAAEAMFDRPAAEMLNHPFTINHPPESAARYEGLFNQLITDGGGVVEDIDALTQGGRRIRAQVFCTAFRPGGRLIMQGIVRDVTARKQAEEQVVRRAEILAAVHYASESLLATSAWQDVADDVFEHVAPGLRVDGIRLFQSHAHEDDRLTLSLSHQWTASGVKVPSGTPEDAQVTIRVSECPCIEAVSRGELTVCALDGFLVGRGGALLSPDAKSVLMAPVFAGGTLWGILAVERRRVTWGGRGRRGVEMMAQALGAAVHRRNVEDALRFQSEVIEALAVGAMVVRDSDRRIVYVNPYQAEMFGYRQDELVGQPVSILTTAGDASEAHCIHEQITRGLSGHGRWSGEIPCLRRDGSSFLCEGTISLLWSPEHGLVRVLGNQDITLRRRAANELRISEERLRAIMASLHETVIALFDFDGRILTVGGTEWMLEQYGYELEDVIGKTFGDLYPPALAEQRTALLQEVFRSRKPSRDEYRSPTPTGEHWLEVTRSPVFGADGAVTAVVDFIRDVTDQKTAADRVRQRARALEAVHYAANALLEIGAWQEVIDDVLAHLGPGLGVDGVHFFENRSNDAGHMALELTHHWTSPSVEPPVVGIGGRAVTIRVAGCPYAEAIVRGELVECAAAEFLSNQGAKLLSPEAGSVLSAPIFSGKTLWGLLSLERRRVGWRDLARRGIETTARTLGAAIHRRCVEDAARFQSEIVEGLAIGVVVVRADDLRIAYINPHHAALLGYCQDELVGKSVVTLTTPPEMDGPSAVHGRIAAALSREGWWSGEVPSLHKEGHTLWTETTISTLQSPEYGEVKVGVTQDITVRKQSEREIRRYQQRLRSLASALSLSEERQRRQLGTDLHDGLGQTLALVKMRLGMMDPAAGSDGLASQLTEIGGLVDEAHRSVRSLSFRLSPPVLHDFGLVPALQWLAEDIQQRYGLNIHIDEAGRVEPTDEEIRVILFRCLREVLINIAKHAQVDYASVRLHELDHGVRVIVADEGVGFDTPDPLRDAGAGGFGLFSVREQLTFLGGRFEIRSSPGRGTVVILEAPVGAQDGNA